VSSVVKLLGFCSSNYPITKLLNHQFSGGVPLPPGFTQFHPSSPKVTQARVLACWSGRRWPRCLLALQISRLRDYSITNFASPYPISISNANDLKFTNTQGRPLFRTGLATGREQVVLQHAQLQRYGRLGTRILELLRVSDAAIRRDCDEGKVYYGAQPPPPVWWNLKNLQCA